jgi:hypothetical protein
MGSQLCSDDYVLSLVLQLTVGLTIERKIAELVDALVALFECAISNMRLNWLDNCEFHTD